MNKLAEIRPIFHSEADFQFALAWELQKEYPTATVRLERRFLFPVQAKPMYIDIWVELEGVQHPIELKYQTIASAKVVRGEVFQLSDQGAEDYLGYDFLKDVSRIESVVQTCTEPAVGCVILLANQALWNDKPRQKPYNKDAFRLFEGRDISGCLSWRNTYSTNAERHAPICLTGNYRLEWRHYSPDLGFQYLYMVCTKVMLQSRGSVGEIRTQTKATS